MTLDAKGWVFTSSRHCEALQLQVGGWVIVIRYSDSRLMLFPRPEWERFRKRIAAFLMGAHWWKRIFLGSATDVELDTTDRVLIAPELRAATPLERDMMLPGTGSHFEVWDAATYTAKEQVIMA